MALYLREGRDPSAGLAKGLSEGLQTLVEAKMQERLQQQKLQQMLSDKAAAESKPYSVFEIPTIMKKGLHMSDAQLDDFEPSDFEQITNSTNQYIKSGLPRPQSLLRALEDMANPPTEGSQMPGGLQAFQSEESAEENETWGQALKKGIENLPGLGSLFDPVARYTGAVPEALQAEGIEPVEQIKRGFGHATPSRGVSAAKGEGFKAFEERTGLKKDTGELNKFFYNVGEMGGDLASYLIFGKAGAIAGGALGAAVTAPTVIGVPFGAAAGAAIGGPVAAFAGTSMLRESLIEYQKHLDEGGKGSFGKFLKSSKKVIGAGGAAIPEALLLGVISKIAGGSAVLKSTGSKAAQKILDVAKKAVTFTSAKAASRLEVPSFSEYATDFLMFGGFELAHVAGKTSKPLYEKLKKANIPPKEAAERVQQVAQEKGYDLNKPKDMARAITDITKKRTKISSPAKVAIEQVKPPEGTITETAEALAERPIEKYIAQDKASKAKKERGLTERETLKRKVAEEGIPVLEEKIKAVEDDVLFLREKIADKEMPRYHKRLAQKELDSVEADLKELKIQKEDLEGIAKHGQKPFRESDIDKHMKEIEEVAASPASEEAKKLNRLFERDQKWIDKGLQLDKKGKLPPQSHTDYRIKILEAYQKAYSKAIDKLENNVKTLSRSKQKAHANQLNLLKKNLKINEAKIKLHKDKLNSLYELIKPGSALVKQRLKSLRTDVVELQRDYVKLKQIADSIEKKTSKAFEDKLRPLMDKILKDPDMSLKNISEKTGIPEVELVEVKKEAKKTGRQFVEEVKKKVKDGTLTKDGLKGMVKELFSAEGEGKKVLSPKDIIKKAIFGKSKTKSLIKSIIFYGSIRSLLEDAFDIKVPFSVIGFFTKGKFKSRRNVAAFLHIANQMWKKFPLSRFKKRYSKAKNFSERQVITREMKQKGYTNSQIREVHRKAA